jgi:hypothetical protein
MIDSPRNLQILAAIANRAKKQRPYPYYHQEDFGTAVHLILDELADQGWTIQRGDFVWPRDTKNRRSDYREQLIAEQEARQSKDGRTIKQLQNMPAAK